MSEEQSMDDLRHEMYDEDRVQDPEKARVMAEAERPHQEKANERFDYAKRLESIAEEIRSEYPEEAGKLLDVVEQLNQDANWGDLNMADSKGQEAGEKYDSEKSD